MLSNAHPSQHPQHPIATQAQLNGFEAWLTSHPSYAIDYRINELEECAKNYSGVADLTKLASGGALILSAVLSINPIIAVTALPLSVAALVLALFHDTQYTGKFFPLPTRLLTGGQFLQTLAKYEEDTPEGHNIINALPPEWATEYQMLNQFEDEIIEILEGTMPAHRLGQYRYILRFYRATKTLPVEYADDGYADNGQAIAPIPPMPELPTAWPAQPGIMPSPVAPLPQAMPQHPGINPIANSMPTTTIQPDTTTPQSWWETPEPIANSGAAQVTPQPTAPTNPIANSGAITPASPLQPPVVNNSAIGFSNTDAIAPINPTPTPSPAAPQPPQPFNIIQQLAVTRLSIVLSAVPEVGKTTTILAWLAHVFHFYPEAIVFVASWKNDEFLGLRHVQDVVEVLDGVDFEPLLRQVNRVFDILQERRQLPKSQRATYENSPVWLLLGDYFATVRTLSRSNRYKALWEEVCSKVGVIITVGREFRVGVCADTHSLNTAALGISDGYIRDCLILCALGRLVQDDTGREDGGYGPIYKAIKNKLIVDDDAIRNKLLTQDLPALQRQSDLTGRPVMFTTMGNPPRLLLLDDLRAFETYQLSSEILQGLAQRLADQATLQRSHSTAPQAPSSSSTIFDLQPISLGNGQSIPLQIPMQLKVTTKSTNGASSLVADPPAQGEKRYTLHQLPADTARTLIKSIRTQMGMTDAIKLLWNVNPGGSEEWAKAREEYRELMGE